MTVTHTEQSANMETALGGALLLVGLGATIRGIMGAQRARELETERRAREVERRAEAVRSAYDAGYRDGTESAGRPEPDPVKGARRGAA